MEDLNKNQIVLLTLLVSFVTSIATGIVTVTLMDQAPPGVTQTVNRIVERTVERVVPGEATEQTVIREVPVLVSQEEIILDIVRGAEPAIVRLADSRGEVTFGTGFIIDNAGTIITAGHLIPPTDRRARPYRAYLHNGQYVEVRLIKSSLNPDIAILRAVDPGVFASAVGSLVAAVGQATSSSAGTRAWKPLSLAADTTITSGQTVVGLGTSEGTAIVSGGLVSALTGLAEAGAVRYIKTNAVNNSNLGGPLLNTKGLVIGLGHEAGSALAASTISGYSTAE